MEETAEKKVKKRDNKKIFLVIGVAILLVAGIHLIVSKNLQKYSTDSDAQVSITEAPQSLDKALTSKTWTWVNTQMTDGTQVLPSDEGAFGLTFKTDLSLQATTDCNNGNGNYLVGVDGTMVISPLASTMMFCEGSTESQFFAGLQSVESYSIKDGQLSLTLKDESGTMIFK